MAFGLIYYNDITSSQRFEKAVRVEILERDYVGSSSQIKVQPLISISKSGDGREESIKKKTCILKMLSERSLQFEHLFTSDDRKYQVKVYYDSDLVFTGFLESDSYEEPYSFYENYEIELTARDNLGRLEDIDYVDSSGDRITGLQRITQILSFVLGKTGNSLLTNNFIDIYASGQDENIDHWGQTYINTSGFWNVTNNEPISCFDVLERILKGYGAQIRQVGEFWEIREQAGYYNAPNIDVDDVLPRFMQDRLNFPVVPNETYWLNQSARLALQPAWKSFELIQDYGTVDTIFDDFPKTEEDYTYTNDNPPLPNTATINGWDMKDINYITTSNGGSEFIIRKVVVSEDWIEPPVIPVEQTDLAVTLSLRACPSSLLAGIGDKVEVDLLIDDGAGDVRILTDSGWVAYTSQEREIQFSGISTDILTDLKLIIDGFPISGDVKIKFFASNPSVGVGATKFAEAKLILDTVFGGNPSEKTIIGDIDDNNNVKDEFRLSIGEVPNVNNSKIIFLGGLFDSSGSALTGWHRKGDSTNKTLLQVVAEGYDLLNNKVSRQISGSLFWQWDVWTNIKDQGKILMLNSGTWDLVNDRINNAEWVEVFEYKNTLGAFDRGYDSGFDNSYNLIKNGMFSNNLDGWDTTYWTIVSGEAYHAPSSIYNKLMQTLTNTPSVDINITIKYNLITANGTMQFFYKDLSDTIHKTLLTTGENILNITIPSGDIKEVYFSRVAGNTGEMYVDYIIAKESGDDNYNTNTIFTITEKYE